ncbi:MAG: SDR family NAD(P)-dependent oxidoreductase [Bacteroides sp.]|nr:SDR family NAD(P)-dependent oxidoreductase [Bacillota bacterium]MCM1394442.1 SDR family NAD(P)-dependent oxidoreductase [[Eubacterium] siraeum]MCM1455873.1 SDR family NAD(P)-dependent oxidoreductase [Bacteroides sp.]
MSKQIAIITGANSGIGKEFTKIISDYNEIDEIWAIALDVDKLNEVKRAFGEKIRIFSMDLTDRNNLTAIELLLQTENPRVKYLVNCAGAAEFGDYSAVSNELCLNMIDLNINALVYMCNACLPYMKENSHIINMASQASFQPVPYQNVYSATKAFVRNYTRALNVELNGKGISATAVCPGWMDTNLIERADIGANKATNEFPFMVEPYPVAKKALDDAKNNKDMSVYGLAIKLSHLMSKLLPQRLLMKIWVLQQNISPEEE